MNADGQVLASSPPAAPAPDSEAAFRAQVERSLQRNFTGYLLHGIFAQAGLRLVQAPTFLPAYVYGLSGSSLIVGLARSIQALGMLTTPVLGARLIEHRRRVLPMVFGTGAGMRLSLLGVALAGYFLGTHANLVAICVLMGLFGVFTGMQGVTFSFLVSKVIPVEKRGALGGARNATGLLFAASVGGIGGYSVDHHWLGNGYATVFLISFLMAAVGLVAVVIMREPESPGVRPRTDLFSRLRELPALMRADADFRAYTYARALGAGGRMAVPYYALYVGKVMTLPLAALGWLTVAFSLGQMAGTLGGGLIADRRGFARVLALSLLIWIGSTVLLMTTREFALVLVCFAGLGAGQVGFENSCTNLVLEFGAREDLPMRIALAQSAEQAVNVVAPLLGGAIVAQLSFVPMFWLAIAVQALALAVVALKVVDPRHRAAANQTR